MFGINRKRNISFDPKRFRKYSYSQCGEDVLVEYIFSLRGVHFPSYIDIGANHPYFLSNTAKFYEKGCRGVVIEANPTLAAGLRRCRPDDVVLNVGIGATGGEMDFYIMKDNTLSTFSRPEAESMVAHGKEIAEVKRIRVTTMQDVLNQYCNCEFPDFMSLDAEGMDYEILRSITFERSSPKVICVEVAEYSPDGAGARRSGLVDFLTAKGYFEYANTNLNAIMVKKEFWRV